MLISYRDWRFDVDIAATSKYYAETEKGWADDCSCGDCLLYANNREATFPKEVIALFNELGIDYCKEPEMYTIDLSPTDMLCHGWYYFKGEIIVGPAQQIIEISPTFSISFEKCGPNGFPSDYFAKNTRLVQVNFSLVIEKP
jgi:hypothetical protein